MLKGKAISWWKDNQWFFIPYLLFIVCSFSLVLLYNKKDLHIMLNGFGNPALDGFFSCLTYLGDGYSAIFLCIILLFFRYRYSLILFVSYLLSAFFVQILKHFVFGDMERPLRYFEGTKGLRWVPGVDMHSYYSFPSGHATTAFVIFTCLAFFSKNNSFKLFCFILAFLTSWSRVYLSQHFLSDISAGSLLGTATVILVYLFSSTSEKFNRMKWPDKKLALVR